MTDILAIILLVPIAILITNWICEPRDAHTVRLRKMLKDTQAINADLRAQLLDATGYSEKLTEAANTAVSAQRERAEFAEHALEHIRACPETKLCPHCARLLEPQEAV